MLRLKFKTNTHDYVHTLPVSIYMYDRSWHLNLSDCIIEIKCEWCGSLFPLNQVSRAAPEDQGCRRGRNHLLLLLLLLLQIHIY